ncbi:baseplate hub assembly chaperone [Acinetobacter phage Minot]|nr:baseplate hub assembly chaperone [Acinetobacter phage Minot]QQO96640.1 baseplate hub assembly chaperone [Acinetobacter phage Mokit]QQO96895.1 baseplate hub subunit [Acinetobacter phage Melin]
MFEKTFDVKLNGQLVKCKSYTLHDYTKLIISKDSPTSDAMKSVYTEIINKCTGLTNLPKHDAELVLINLIANSEHFGEVKQDYVCECGHTQPVNLDVSKAQIDYGESSLEKLYPFRKFKLAFKWPELWDDDDVPTMIAKSIESIYVGNEKILIEDLNELEIEDLYNAITEDDINYIKKFLLAPMPVLVVPITCAQCGKAHVHVIKGFKEFVEIL